MFYRERESKPTTDSHVAACRIISMDLQSRFRNDSLFLCCPFLMPLAYRDTVFLIHMMQVDIGGINDFLPRRTDRQLLQKKLNDYL